ncbi:hypothetical protein E3N88_42125 [Mikania micrantha]|uniref:Uncharacterized protein n=1 Tax=Mikania micrantha TaxID=192012 RepID=A0A5N6LIM4_9ASTR|nr:hypothetical protein E3N88_42125 [Mikania micrantha]
MSTLFYRYLHTISSPPSKSSIITYLTESLGFPKSRAVLFVNRFSSTETNPQSVIHYLKSHGFKNTDIQKWVTESPQILFSDVEKTLKSRIQFFSRFRSRWFRFGNENLIRTLSRCNWVDIKQPATRVYANIKYLEQCGIVGAQLATVIARQPRLLIMGESELKDLVSKVLDMGFTIDSRMLVHALYTVSCLSDQTFKRKSELFQSYGFTKVEFLCMFRKAPGLLRVSESKLKSGIDFFLNTVKLEKQVLLRRPTCLMLSLDERVIPRYKVLNILMSKKVLKKMPRFLSVMWLPEDEFLVKSI